MMMSVIIIIAITTIIIITTVILLLLYFLIFFFQTPLGLIFKNENANEDTVKILKQFHSFFPKTGDQGVDG